MRRIVYWLMMGFLVVGLSFGVYAEEAKENKVSTLLFLRHEWVKPEQNTNYNSQSLFVFWQYKWFGAGLDTTMRRKSDYLEARPFLAFNKGPWYLVGGFSTNSQDMDFGQAGIWYLNNHGKLFVFADIRNYWSIDGKKTDYLDTFLELLYPVAKKIQVGIDLTYDHWWRGSSHNWYQIGPILRYDFNQNIALHLRPTREWDVMENVKTKADSLRLELRFCF